MIFRNNKKITTKDMVLMSILISIALALSYIESFIPVNMLIPGVKLGLANIVTLFGLSFFSFYEVFLIVIIRVIINAMFSGSIVSFFYSLAGGILSLVFMSITIKLSKKIFTTIGISVIGAIFHNTGQVIVLAILSKSISIALYWYPYLLVSGLISGIITGFIAKYFLEHYNKLGIDIRKNN